MDRLANTIEGRDSDMLMLDSSLGEITEKLEDGQQERVQLKAQQKSSEQLIEKVYRYKNSRTMYISGNRQGHRFFSKRK